MADGAPFPPLRTPEASDQSRSNTRYIPLQTSATSSEDGENLDPSVALRKEVYASTLSAADTRPTQSPLDGEHPEAASFLKVYALLVLAYPTLLYIMHLLAFTEVRAYKDLMAWATYGALHFASPIIIAWWLWFFAPPGGARTYGWCLGMQNIAGLFTHIIFPNAAPWFYDIYGDSLHPDPPPDYQTPGSAAGLVRVDVILGTHLYASKSLYLRSRSSIEYHVPILILCSFASDRRFQKVTRRVRCLSFTTRRYGSDVGLLCPAILEAKGTCCDVRLRILDVLEHDVLPPPL